MTPRDIVKTYSMAIELGYEYVAEKQTHEDAWDLYCLRHPSDTSGVPEGLPITQLQYRHGAAWEAPTVWHCPTGRITEL